MKAIHAWRACTSTGDSDFNFYSNTNNLYTFNRGDFCLIYEHLLELMALYKKKIMTHRPKMLHYR